MADILQFGVRTGNAAHPIDASLRRMVEINRLLALSTMARALARIIEGSGPDGGAQGTGFIDAGNEIIRRLANFGLPESATPLCLRQEAEEIARVHRLSSELQQRLVERYGPPDQAPPIAGG